MNMQLFYKLAEEMGLEFEEGEMTEEDFKYFMDIATNEWLKKHNDERKVD